MPHRARGEPDALRRHAWSTLGGVDRGKVDDDRRVAGLAVFVGAEDQRRAVAPGPGDGVECDARGVLCVTRENVVDRNFDSLVFHGLTSLLVMACKPPKRGGRHEVNVAWKFGVMAQVRRTAGMNVQPAGKWIAHPKRGRSAHTR